MEDFKQLEPYLEKIGDVKLKNEVEAVMGLQFGARSPLFNLVDTSGKFHELATMKGKVIYIDLWASWCGPCKEETPYLKQILNSL